MKNLTKDQSRMLIDFADNGLLSEVKNLCENYPELNVNYLHGRALQLAASSGHLDVVKYLVEEKNADIHLSHEISLRAACTSDNLEVVKYLVSKGADIHVLGDKMLALTAEDAGVQMWQYVASHIEIKNLTGILLIANDDILAYIVTHYPMDDKCVDIIKAYQDESLIELLDIQLEKQKLSHEVTSTISKVINKL